MERLEARICELAGHLTAATCQFLLLLADFDARRGWADWEMPSCAAWLSWKCQIASGTAREHVRVARTLGSLPVIRAGFAAARLSYAKVRALTRIATPETDKDLAAMAMPMTANQLERFAQAHRRVSRVQDQEVRARRRFTWRHEDDTAMSFNAYLAPADGAVVLQAIRAAVNDLEHPHDGEDVSAETRAARLKDQDARDGVDLESDAWPARRMEDAQTMADALVAICAEYLQGKISKADNPDLYQVVIHAGAEAVTADDVPAQTPASLPVSHPAHRWRCHIEDGPAISPQALKLIGCNATVTTMVHDLAGNVLNVGRRTRKPPPGLRRAVRERDRYRCRFPGCESRRTDIHHITYWSNGGETKLSGLICLCKRHHTIVHDKDITIATTSDGFAFCTREGTLIAASPPLPPPAGDITTTHTAAITPSSIIPPNSGERLDLHHAIWIAFANARANAVKAAEFR
jgi:Domain of unknown function (DUF222)